MFVNGIAFLTTLLKDIILLTSKHFTSCTENHISSSLIKVTKLYDRGGFIVRVTLMDMEFEKVADEVDLVEVNTTFSQ